MPETCSVQPNLPPKPVFEDDKWYYCTVDAFGDQSSKTGCDQDFIIRMSSCRQGSVIDAWLNGNHECQAGWELMYYNENTAQRLVDSEGPYDSQQDCSDAH